jgi:hypothetical protein
VANIALEGTQEDKALGGINVAFLIIDMIV